MSIQRAREALDRLEQQYTAETKVAQQERREIDYSDPESVMDGWKKTLAHNFYHRFDKYVGK